MNRLIATLGACVLMRAALFSQYAAPLPTSISPPESGGAPAPIPFAEIGTKVSDGYSGEALGITATAYGAHLRSGFQKLEAHATREGLALRSTEEGEGTMHLVSSSIGRSGPDARLPAHGTVAVEERTVRYARRGITEEYSVSADGVRQDFIIHERPAGSGDVRLRLALRGAMAHAVPEGAVIVLDGSGRELAYTRLRVTDARGENLAAFMDVPAGDVLSIRVNDAGAVYPLRIDPTFSDADWVCINVNGGTPGTDGYVSAIAASGAGNVYISGGFTQVGTTPANRIAKWNGSTWSALGSGLGGVANALAISGTDLYAAGGFTTAGGGSANRIAKWNGSAWSALGTGLNDQANALAISGSNVYVGGFFTTAGGVTVNQVARWNGSAWSALGTGTNNFVWALTMMGSDLIAGGSFSTAGGGSANRIARWNGSAWSAMGTGLNDAAKAFTVIGSNLYVGGDFTTAGGSPANRVARWNGSAWSALGSGFNASVTSLANDGSNVYAGGYFVTSGATTVNRLAKWNGTAWTAMGTGLNNEVYALAISGTNIYVGGQHTTAGSTASPYIVRGDLNGSYRLASPRVFLDGPYDTGAGSMRDDLRVAGALPSTEPYTALGFAQAGDGGGETVAPTVLAVTGNDAIVDWVRVELRAAGNAATVVATRQALLQRDGDIVSTDGTSAVRFDAPSGNYFLAVRHRNHNGVMTLNTITLGNTTTTVDFTGTALANYGSNSQKTIGAVRLLWAGNSNGNGDVKYTGGENDRDPILLTVGSTTPNASVSGYTRADVNLDGVAKYTGGGNDRDLILLNVGSTTPNNTRLEQLP